MGSSESKKVIKELIVDPKHVDSMKCREMFNFYDTNGDGDLQFSEAQHLIKDAFEVLLDCMQELYKEKKKSQLYSDEALDRYNAEVQVFKKRIIDPQFIEVAFRKIDTDSSGEIDFVEFETWFRKFIRNSPQVLKDDAEMLKTKLAKDRSHSLKMKNLKSTSSEPAIRSRNLSFLDSSDSGSDSQSPIIKVSPRRSNSPRKYQPDPTTTGYDHVSRKIYDATVEKLEAKIDLLEKKVESLMVDGITDTEISNLIKQKDEALAQKDKTIKKLIISVNSRIEANKKLRSELKQLQQT